MSLSVSLKNIMHSNSTSGCRADVQGFILAPVNDQPHFLKILMLKRYLGTLLNSKETCRFTCTFFLKINKA